ncbi:YtxH domain-containing protein [Schleiferilactobacillus shenzhenensis]|uniref:Uncharacterized protein n=1 Tax=Schleiferilactobacillus shenzhenensis LY-73 TaxID=1231336 RepID=U4TX15_9LACO|nr:hypothetical protein [Schleiferilactobacillus shenzhenensis]ERL66348.1 hypothetical protein L248_0027 [Schleiferilactobacillus shenzhenensis LY-73]
MPKFRTGLFLGVLVGGAYGLFTAKKTGIQQQKETAAYLTEVSDSVKMVSGTVSQLQSALTNLLTQLKTTVPTVQKEVQQNIADFQFQAAPRLKQINETLATLQKDASGFSGGKDTENS